MKIQLRKCFIGTATDETLNDVLEYKLFASNNPVFKEVEPGDIGFIVKRNKESRKEIEEILGIFEAISTQFISKDMPFNTRFPYRVKVRILTDNIIKKDWKSFEEKYPDIADEIRRGSKFKGGWSYVFPLEITKKLLQFFEVDFEEALIDKSNVKSVSLSFDSIIGYERVKRYVRDRIPPEDNKEWLEWQENSDNLELNQKYGILLFGPPGTGKTIFAMALSKEINGIMYEITANMISGYPGEAEERFNRLFNKLLNEPRAVLFIDEAEWILGKRENQTSSVMMRVIPTVLSLITKAFKKRNRSTLFIIASTNNPSAIDEAFLRPGRFGKVFYVPPPNEKHLKKLLQYLLKNKYGSPGGNIEDGDAETVIKWLLEKRNAKYRDFEYSGADIEAFIEEAKIHALKNRRGYIIEDDLLHALEVARPTISKDTIEKMKKFITAWNAEEAHED